MKWLICLLVLPLAACASAGDLGKVQDQLPDLESRVTTLEAANKTLQTANDDLKRQLDTQVALTAIALSKASASAACASAIQKDIEDLRVEAVGLTIESDSLLGASIDGLRVYAGDSHIFSCR